MPSSDLRPARPENESSAHKALDWYLCAVAMFKNEAPYLDEWLAFCVLEGIEHVILYDNASTDRSREILRPWMEAGIVDLVDWPIHWNDEAQIKAHSDALGRLRGRARWAAFIDIDEYLFSPTGKTLPEVLRHYEGHAGIVVNWQCYGTSGHRVRPEGLTIESYTRRAKQSWARNRRGKTIVDPLVAVAPYGPHLFKVLPGHALVTEGLKPARLIRRIKWPRPFRHLAAWLPYIPFDPYSVRTSSIRQVSVSELRINHYVTRSAEELSLKYKDRDRMAARDRRCHWRYHDRNEVEDAVLAAKAARVRDIIAEVHAASGPTSD